METQLEIGNSSELVDMSPHPVTTELFVNCVKQKEDLELLKDIFPNLRTLILNAFDPAMLEGLRGLELKSLDADTDAEEFILHKDSIGPQILSLQNSFYKFDEEDTVKLAQAFPNLEKVGPTRFIDDALILELAKHMPNLRFLDMAAISNVSPLMQFPHLEELMMTTVEEPFLEPSLDDLDIEIWRSVFPNLTSLKTVCLSAKYCRHPGLLAAISSAPNLESLMLADVSLISESIPLWKSLKKVSFGAGLGEPDAALLAEHCESLTKVEAYFKEGINSEILEKLFEKNAELKVALLAPVVYPEWEPFVASGRAYLDEDDEDDDDSW